MRKTKRERRGVSVSEEKKVRGKKKMIMCGMKSRGKKRWCEANKGKMRRRKEEKRGGDASVDGGKMRRKRKKNKKRRLEVNQRKVRKWGKNGGYLRVNNYLVYFFFVSLFLIYVFSSLVLDL